MYTQLNYTQMKQLRKIHIFQQFSLHNLFQYHSQAVQSHILVTACWMEVLEHDTPGAGEEYYLCMYKTYNIVRCIDMHVPSFCFVFTA